MPQTYDQKYEDAVKRNMQTLFKKDRTGKSLDQLKHIAGIRANDTRFDEQIKKNLK